jgi:NDP-sugar pyrophosphorylase family protein
MVPVAGTPMIAYALTWLRANGVDGVAINLHYKPDPIIEFVGDGSAFGLSVFYSREPELLGSSGSLVPLRELFAEEEAFIVLYGDVLTDLPLGDVVAEHRATGADATVVLTTVDDPRRAGMVELDADRRIRRLVEKPKHWDGPNSWANGGIYVLGRRVLDFLPTSGSHDFAFDLFPAMIAAGARLRGYPTDALMLDIGSHERLAAASALVEGGRLPRPRMAA